MAEQRMMAIEEDLSRLAEVSYKEELQKKAWRECELKRIAEWEAIQNQKDIEESEARKKRLAELEVSMHCNYMSYLSLCM